MKKQHVFVIVLILLAAAYAMIERNSPTESDTSNPPEAISAYPVDDWYMVEPTVVFPYEAYPPPEYSGYPAPYWGDPLPTPPQELGEYPYP
jgi:hypothetical protein